MAEALVANRLEQGRSAIMAASDLVNLSGLMDDAKCFALVRQRRWRDRCKACVSRFDDLTSLDAAYRHLPREVSSRDGAGRASPAAACRPRPNTDAGGEFAGPASKLSFAFLTRSKRPAEAGPANCRAREQTANSEFATNINSRDAQHVALGQNAALLLRRLELGSNSRRRSG